MEARPGFVAHSRWRHSHPAGSASACFAQSFLHTNSTSHTWPFSAVAELIDNAYDPDVNAKQIWIDKTVINDCICLTFTDNGNGMTSDKLHKMPRDGKTHQDRFKVIYPR